MEFIALDVHKRYSTVCVQSRSGKIRKECRIEHKPGAIRHFLTGRDKGSPVAVETVGNWYWVVNEIEEAGFEPRLVHAGKAKVMMGMINKTDKLDPRGLNQLQRTGTLPTVWIASREVRDERELPRTRMTLSRLRTQLKNRIHATLAKHGLSVSGVSDIFGVKGREKMSMELEKLPSHTRFSVEEVLAQLDEVQVRMKAFERKIRDVFSDSETRSLLETIPGVGKTLSVVIETEMGDIDRFPDGSRYASYCGTTPRVHSSGGKTRMGKLRSDVNRYLKWAYVEAANVVARFSKVHPERHASKLYRRIRKRRGHHKAVGAVARHLAEATYWMIKKGEPYLEPSCRDEGISSTGR